MKKLQFLKDNTTYNAYIADSTLIDTVPQELADKLLEKIDCSQLDAVIINHSEPDHSGALPHILRKNPNINVVGTPGTLRNLKEIVNSDFNTVTAKENGKYGEFLFKAAPGFPWPDSMVTYYAPEKLLFSGNMFSQTHDGMEDFYTEYFSRVSNNTEYIIGELERLNINAVYPSHGTEILEVNQAFALYKRLGEQKKRKTIAVIYSSKYGYTKEMAETVTEALEKAAEVRLVNADTEDAAFWINNSRAVCIGTPTIHRDMPQCIGRAVMDADIQCIMGKPFMIFGSYGWSGEGMGTLYAVLKTKKAKLFEKPFRCIFRMGEEKKEELKQFTNKFLNFLSEEDKNV